MYMETVEEVKLDLKLRAGDLNYYQAERFANTPKDTGV
jgi:hypothetical protein